VLGAIPEVRQRVSACRRASVERRGEAAPRRPLPRHERSTEPAPQGKGAPPSWRRLQPRHNHRVEDHHKRLATEPPSDVQSLAGRLSA